MSVPLPERMRRLPLDRHRRPVPWFVHIDVATGVPDFRVIGEGKMRDAHRFDLCWVCGSPRGRHAAFVVGPMCAINRVSAEPPSHLECATYSAQACPFLATPTMTRRRTGLGDLDEATAGIALPRNPGVALVWSSRSWMPYTVPPELGQRAAGTLWDLGEPTRVAWYAHGRAATRAEVQASIDSGLPHLREACQLDRDPETSLALLEREIERATVLLPTEEATA